MPAKLGKDANTQPLCVVDTRGTGLDEIAKRVQEHVDRAKRKRVREGSR